MKTPHRPWHQYLWIWSILYFALGFWNILFAWLGMVDFILPLAFALFPGNKWFCNHLCGRGQLFNLLGSSLRLSRQKGTPRLLVSTWFRYGFLVFFMLMFSVIILQTWLVASGARDLRQAVTLLWTFRFPWNWAYARGTLPEASEWIAQFAYGFYSLMLTSTIIGLAVMLLYKPRSWCVFCPMGTMTQGICRLKCRQSRKEEQS